MNDSFFTQNFRLQEIVIPNLIGKSYCKRFKIPACSRMTTTLVDSVNGIG